jgi:hypothetical protein
MKMHLMRAELFRADRRTDMTKLIVAFRKFVNASKNDQMRHEPKVSSTLQKEVVYRFRNSGTQLQEEVLQRDFPEERNAPFFTVLSWKWRQHFLQRNHKQFPEYMVPLNTNNDM